MSLNYLVQNIYLVLQLSRELSIDLHYMLQVGFDLAESAVCPPVHTPTCTLSPIQSCLIMIDCLQET